MSYLNGIYLDNEGDYMYLSGDCTRYNINLKWDYLTTDVFYWKEELLEFWEGIPCEGEIKLKFIVPKEFL